MKLLQVFKDFQIEVKGLSNRYDAIFRVLPKKNPKHLTLKDLERHIQNLQRRYPDRNFYLRHTHVRGKEFYVITRKCYYIGKDGKRHRAYDRVPIYIDLKNQTFYVPASYVKKRRKLVNYICMITLGSLGISQSKYVRMAN